MFMVERYIDIERNWIMAIDVVKEKRVLKCLNLAIFQRFKKCKSIGDGVVIKMMRSRLRGVSRWG